MSQGFSMLVGVHYNSDINISCEARIASCRYSESSDNAAFNIFAAERSWLRNPDLGEELLNAQAGDCTGSHQLLNL
jgi:hypothetical protein